MPAEQHAINIQDIPALQPIAQEVSRTRQRLRLSVDGADVTLVVEPSHPKRSRARRGRRTSADDPFWSLIGTGHSGKTDVSANHDKYLAEWERSTMQ